ncbi:MAG TPA: hypothetical protein VKV28_13910 [Candidatus Binataceae bacterium]|nr:hypothetical protein [Candidatus Binataceae bacterium]
MFTPLLGLGPPGNPKAALAVIDSLLVLQRELLLHPAISPRLMLVEDSLPARQSTLLRAAALYADPKVRWQLMVPDTHYISARGYPEGTDFLYDIAPNPGPPRQPREYTGTFALTPATPVIDGMPDSVIARLEGALYLSDFNPTQALTVIAGALREIYGRLTPPWDSAPGVFNDHDRAAMARLGRDLPTLRGEIERDFAIGNLLDEFADRQGPYVLVNLDIKIRGTALTDYPHLRRFYQRLTARVEGYCDVTDTADRRWLHLGFDLGHFYVVFMLRDGRPVPFDEQMHPAGPPLDLTERTSGRFQTTTSLWVNRLGVKLGIGELRYASSFDAHDGQLSIRSRMTEEPEILAPPGIHALIMLMAGRFMRTLAQGSHGRGASAYLDATPQPQGMMLSGGMAGEFEYSPALEIIARVGDAIVAANDDQVRADERGLLGRLLGAADRDYRRARPRLLSDN